MGRPKRKAATDSEVKAKRAKGETDLVGDLKWAQFPVANTKIFRIHHLKRGGSCFIIGLTYSKSSSTSSFNDSEKIKVQTL
jgi:hypothetical protein